MRKIISAILTISLLLSLGIPFVSAVDNNTITEADINQALNSDVRNMWNAVLDSPEALGFTNEDVQNAYIGDSFQIVRNDDNVTEIVNNIVYLPVISNQKIIALITLIKYDGVISCSIGKDFAPQLSDYLDGRTSQVALFSNGTSIYGVTPSSEVTSVFNSPENTVKYQRSNSMPISYADIAKGNNVVSKEKLTEETYEIPEVLTRAADSYKYLTNFPIVFQGSLSICWAASSAAIIMFEKPSVGELYATTVCNKIGHSYTKGTHEDVIKALKAYLPSIYVPTSYNRPMNVSEVQVIINNIDPAYMSSKDVNNSKIGHATSLCGYAWYGNTSQIRLMDSAYECFKFSTYSGNVFRFAFGNTQFEWKRTVRLLYNV